MDDKQFFVFMLTPEGRQAISSSYNILNNAGPEVDDADLLKQIMALGMPQWAAARVFYHCTFRYAPLTCKYCSREFIPRALRTMSRPYCNTCRNNIVFGPRPPDAAFKEEARRKTNFLISRGKLGRKPCEKCGWRSAHGHHPDYSKPYLIVWLCPRCHAAEHKRLRDEAKPKPHPMSAVKR